MPSLFTGEFEVARTGVAKGVSGAISVTTQVALAAGVVSISGAMPHVVEPAAQPLRYISAVVMPSPAPENILPLPPVAAVAPREVLEAEPAPERPALVAVREFENNAVPTPTATEVRPIESSVKPTPPAPVPPKPVVGAFANSATIAKTPEPAGRIESAGFNAPAAESRQSHLGAASVGTFQTASTTGAHQRGGAIPAQDIVADTGFNQAAAAAPTQPSRMIRESGFGSSSHAERPKTHHIGELKHASFGDARTVEPVRRAAVAAAAPAVIPVEVLSKPVPAYTDAARRLKIEGEVVLEVEFLASGAVRVLRVVRGLGHGLDESAAAAAQEIRFNPASSEGRAVDSRATVHIVFRLA
jgi:TonB family protein